MQETEFKRQQELEDLAEVLALPAGQRFFSRMLQLSNYLGASYAPGQTRVDALTMAYNEGLRRMGQFMATEAALAAPEKIGKLLAGKF